VFAKDQTIGPTHREKLNEIITGNTCYTRHKTSTLVNNIQKRETLLIALNNLRLAAVTSLRYFRVFRVNARRILYMYITYIKRKDPQQQVPYTF